MTSSYNLSRRSAKEMLSPTAWEVQQKQGGICPPNYLTVPIISKGNACSDWKFCVPIKPCDEPCYSKKIVQKRTRTTDMYNMKTSRSYMNHYPIAYRHPNTIEHDKHDYYRLPPKFDGTGYNKESSRGWFPLEARDTPGLTNEWSPFHLIQKNALTSNSFYYDTFYR